MFLLFLIGLGAAGVKAQVRIGGSGAPNAAAVLDLNADDSDAGNKGALALPRVSLANATAQLNGHTPLAGMLVYNTGGSLPAGVYYWNSASWIRLVPEGAYTTWTKVFDAIVSTPALNQLGFARIAAPTVNYGDKCTCDAGGGFIICAETQQFLVGNVFSGPSAPAASFRVRCYHPSN